MHKLLTLVLLASLSVTLSSFANNAGGKKKGRSVSKKRTAVNYSRNYIFPVSGKKSNIGSFWGEVRGGGTRSHEGIDIFAKKGTPVVSICDGVVTQVQNEEVGGKIVRVRSSDNKIDAYYAHLDKQKVKIGQIVKKGELLGTVGNTGNAKTTPSHLHFGIYTNRGAINPLPYVKNSPKLTEPIKKENLDKQLAKLKETKDNKDVIIPALNNAIATNAIKTTGSNKQMIVKTIRMVSDPNGTYYVTSESKVVRMQNGKLLVVGKFNKTNNSKFPYSIYLRNNQTITVNSQGKLISMTGQHIGTIS